MYTATEKRPDFKLIRKRFLPKCVCLRGSAPDPAGGLTALPDPQLEKVGLHTNPSDVPPLSYPDLRPCVKLVANTHEESILDQPFYALPDDDKLDHTLPYLHTISIADNLIRSIYL